jgi:hypothetical protein
LHLLLLHLLLLHLLLLHTHTGRRRRRRVPNLRNLLKGRVRIGVGVRQGEERGGGGQHVALGVLVCAGLSREFGERHSLTCAGAAPPGPPVCQLGAGA